MSKPTFAERCLLAEQCLPDAPYRAMLKKLHSEMLEALAEQPAQQQYPLTDGYVQFVPDKCDRIVWRTHYYHLPICTSAAQPAQQTCNCRWDGEVQVQQ